MINAISYRPKEKESALDKFNKALDGITSVLGAAVSIDKLTSGGGGSNKPEPDLPKEERPGATDLPKAEDMIADSNSLIRGIRRRGGNYA